VKARELLRLCNEWSWASALSDYVKKNNLKVVQQGEHRGYPWAIVTDGKSYWEVHEAPALQVLSTGPKRSSSFAMDREAEKAINYSVNMDGSDDDEEDDD
jgi:hypothetical protein